MDTLSWMTFTLAIATFLLAGAAFGSIWQTRGMQKREHKERLLNEIIEWAINISKFDSDLLSLTESVRLDLALPSTITVDKLHSDTTAFASRGGYIEKTAYVAGVDANDAAKKIQKELVGIAQLLNQFRILNELANTPLELITTEDADLNDKDPKKDTVERHRKNLAQLCNLIIEEAVKIKIKDIN